MPMEAKGTRGERHDAGARGNRGGGMGGGGRKSDAPPHAGFGGGAVAGLGNPGGGFNPRSRPNNAPFAGMPSFQPRRAMNPSPSYRGTLENFGKMAMRGLPGPGLIGGAIQDIAGLRPGFSGFTGNVNGPGDYDPKNAMQNNGLSGIQPLRGLHARPQQVAPALQGLLARAPQTVGPKTFSVGGGAPYSVTLPGRRYF